MFDMFRRMFPSHYEEKAESVKITLQGLTTNEKIVEACKNLEDYAREYTPAKELTKEQNASIEAAKKEAEMNRYFYDNGMWIPPVVQSRFRIKE
jgi:hypothetical protein